MQENTWARSRESSKHQGASHATYPTYFPAYLYISAFTSYVSLSSCDDRYSFFPSPGNRSAAVFAIYPLKSGLYFILFAKVCKTDSGGGLSFYHVEQKAKRSRRHEDDVTAT